MSTSPPDDTTAIRQELRSWLSDNWDPTIATREWWNRLADAGWSTPHWPIEWGGQGLDEARAGAVREELGAAGALGPPSGAAPHMGAPILFEFGTEEQRTRWLPRIARGLESWGQFFSEPGAGSDLASVQTKAVRDGDEWIIDGQKVWNSGTFETDRALLVTRTDPGLPKHRGITFFVIDVHQPGIEIRPIRQMNGSEEFNEAFFDGARVADANRVGEVNHGWAVALLVLAHERANSAGGGDGVVAEVPGGERHGYLDLPAGAACEVAAREQAANRLPIRDLAALVELARTHDRLGDATIRQRIAHIHAFDEALRWTVQRSRGAGAAAGSMSSVAYLGGTRVTRLYRDLIGDIAGAAAMLDGTPVSESITTAPCHGIQGGSEQIQMNVIGERILGLPKEPQVDRDIPFREVRVGTQT